MCNPKSSKKKIISPSPNNIPKEHSEICPNSNKYNHAEYTSTRSGIKQGCIQCYKYFNYGITENNMKHSCDRFNNNNNMNVPIVPSAEKALRGALQ